MLAALNGQVGKLKKKIQRHVKWECNYEGIVAILEYEEALCTAGSVTDHDPVYKGHGKPIIGSVEILVYKLWNIFFVLLDFLCSMRNCALRNLLC